MAQQATERANGEWGASYGALFPSVTGTASYTRNQYAAEFALPTGLSDAETITIIPRNQLEAAVRVDVPLLDVRAWLKVAAAASSVEAQRLREASTWETVQRQVAQGFFSHLSARAVVDSAKKSLKLAQAQWEQTQAKSAAGTASELEVSRAVAEVARGRQVLAEADKLLATSARALESLSGLAPKSLPNLPDQPSGSLVELSELEEGVDSLPAVRAASSEATAASRSAASAGLALLPSVAGQFTQRFTNATGFQGEPSLYNAGLNLTWRLDVPTAQTFRAQNANARLASLSHEKARQQARDALHSDWHSVKAAILKVEAIRSQLQAAKRASELAKERYAAGVATQLEVIQADRDLFASEVNDIQARSELSAARVSLKLSAGQPLEGSP